MADRQQLQVIRQGKSEWNRWRAENPDIIPDLIEANLGGADLLGADLSGADLSEAHVGETVFGNSNLSSVKGLDTCVHHGPSILDHRTVALSGQLPYRFFGVAVFRIRSSNICPRCSITR